MNKAKVIKIFMIVIGIVAAVAIVSFMILNHYLFDLDFIYVLVICILILFIWIIINYVGIKIILSKK